MKKAIICTLLLTAFAASAYAANGSAELTSNTVSVNAAQIFGGVDVASAQLAATPLIKMSNGVKGLVNGTTTEYMIMTKHTSGSKNFGTAGDTTSIFWSQEAKGDLVNTKSIASNASNFTAANKWTAQ